MLRSSSLGVARDEVLEFSRSFAAPRELVFRMFGSREHLLRWYGPEGMRLTHCELDFREGGHWRFCMSNYEGRDHWIHGTYREIRAPERLAFTYINDDDGFETLVEMDFLDSGAGTELRFRQSPFLSLGERDGHSWGWMSTLQLLSEYLALVRNNGGQPVGRTRIDGVAADMIAAPERMEEKQNDVAAEDR